MADAVVTTIGGGGGATLFAKSNDETKGTPSVGFQGGAGLTAGEWLEKAFFPFIDASVAFDSVGYQERGVVTSVVLNGDIFANDETGFSNFLLKNSAGATIEDVAGSLTTPTGPNTSAQPWTSTQSMTATDTLTMYINVANNSQLKYASRGVNFYYPTYYAAHSTSALNEAGIKTYAGTSEPRKKLLPGKSNYFDYTVTNGYYYVAYPASHGTLTSVINELGWEVVTGFGSPRTENWTQGGDTVSYYVYQWDSLTTATNFRMTFS